MSSEHKDVDQHSGTETTGHEWDGIKELNTPLPKWWLYTFYVTVVWALGYFIVFPAIPYFDGSKWDATGGVINYDQRAVVAEAVEENEARLKPYTEAIVKASFQEILADQELMDVAYAGGSIAFKENCAGCHGTGAQGFVAFPNLNDDDWLWGGTIEDIHQTITHGIRWEQDYDTRYSQMPSFGSDEILEKEDIKDVTQYVMQLGGLDHSAEAAARGATVFEEQCSVCHAADGKGDKTQGAPNLTDAIWLFGSDRETIYETIYYARNSVMPAWKERLDEATIKKLAVYVYSLGGGVEPSDAAAR